MVREHLSALTIEGGRQLLELTDTLSMQAQGAMWVFNYDIKDWRYYLITSLVDTLGRRRTYKSLIDMFAVSNFGEGITSDDVHLASPNDELFLLISQVVRVDGGLVKFENCNINNVSFDGVVYRSIRFRPSDSDAEKIEKKFLKKLKDYAAEYRRKNVVRHDGKSLSKV